MKKEVKILPSSVFVGQGYVQRGENKLRGSRCFRFYRCLVLANHSVPDAVAFAFGDSTNVGSRTDALFVEQVDRCGEADVGVVKSKKGSSEDNGEKKCGALRL